jgi:hypothetical protein
MYWRGHAAPTVMCQRQNREDRGRPPLQKGSFWPQKGGQNFALAERQWVKSDFGHLPLEIDSPGLSLSPFDAPR